MFSQEEIKEMNVNGIIIKEIESIEEINCIVRLRVFTCRNKDRQKYSTLNLEIESTFNYTTQFMDEKENEYLKIGDFLMKDQPEPNMLTSEILEKFLLETLERMTFNKYQSRFTFPNKVKEESLKKRCDLLKNNEKINLRGNGCCVCYDLTTTKTCCGHYVCVPCLSKIKNNVKNDQDENPNPNAIPPNAKCPLCRKSVTYIDSSISSIYNDPQYFTYN